MPLDELQRVEIAIELDKGVSHEELARKFSTSVSELKNIAKLILENDVSSKQKVHRKRKPGSDRGLIIQKLLRGELPEKISEDFEVSLKVIKHWALEEGVQWHKCWSELSATEKREIQSLREEGENWEEIAKAYKLHIDGEELIPPLPYQTLSPAEVGLLIETFNTKPSISISGACQLALQAGMELQPKPVASYKRRWLRFNHQN